MTSSVSCSRHCSPLRNERDEGLGGDQGSADTGMPGTTSPGSCGQSHGPGRRSGCRSWTWAHGGEAVRSRSWGGGPACSA